MRSAPDIPRSSPELRHTNNDILVLIMWLLRSLDTKTRS